MPQIYKIDLDAISTPARASEQKEGVSLAVQMDSMTQLHMKHNMLMAVASAVSAVQPSDEVTLVDIMMDAIGWTTVKLDDAGDEEHFNIQYDDEAFQYALNIVMDFAGALGMSDSAILDMFEDDHEIAMDEVQSFASAMNSAIPEDGDIAQLVTAYVHFDSIVEDFANDEELQDGVQLDNVTLDWSFSKKKIKRKAKTGTGHTMKTVECHRTIGGVRKKGFCRYPASLLKGKKYKKASGVSPKQKTHLAEMVTDAHTAQAERRRALNMKLTRDARSGAASKSAKAKM